MKCPTCPDSTLLMSERQGVEIDYCPTCRGVWLDRGELDKLLERSRSAEAEPGRDQPRSPAPAPQQPYQAPYQAPYQSGGYPGHKPYKKKRSWLDEIFD